MPGGPKVWAFFGLIASGKSYLAEGWAARHGFLHLNSDRIRKELAGAAAASGRGAAANQGIYTPEFSRRTYDEMLHRAAMALAARCSVLLDASFQSRTERDLLRAWADNLGVALHFVQCICPEEEVKRRLQLRAADPAAASDGRWEILLLQRSRFEPPTELTAAQLLTLATDRPVEMLLAELDKTFEVTRHV
ncbi:MAG: AAA family ATPase [Desulfobulbaceae bacterium]|nr:AAA family ATPase [Desulfobulbaceae bacterium]